jgi:hypothetical protein
MYFREQLAWVYGVEALVGMAIIFASGLLGSIRSTIPVFWGILALASYPLVAFLLIVLHSFGFD